jgi:hypothetical protein
VRDCGFWYPVHPSEGEQNAMDGATDLSRKVLVRSAALGLAAVGLLPGCSRVNPFLRDEPPMLGTVNPGKAGSTRAAATAGPKSTATAADRVASSRSSTARDVYAQSFNRTRPRPTEESAAPAQDQPAPGEAAPALAGAASENSLRATALQTASDASNPLGVVLKPPLPMHPTPEEPPRAAGGPSEPAPPEPPVSAPPPEASRSVAPTVESVVASARQRLDALQSYQVAINRQERVGDHLQEPEDVLLSIRRNPRAVRLQWQEGPHQGREALFAEKETGGMLQVNMADSKLPMPRISLPPDSPLALRNSRHPITEAGFDTIVGNLEKTLDENRAGDFTHGRIAYGGLEKPTPLDRPCHKIVRVTAPGETWQVFFDPESKLPAMVQANALDGALVERYLFRSVRPDPPELAAADAFDPNQRWGESKGLLGRLAGAIQTHSAEPATTR